MRYTLVLLVLTAVLIYAFLPGPTGPEGLAEVNVVVVAPDGADWLNGTVIAGPPDAVTALAELGAKHGVGVQITGTGCNRYVERVGQHGGAGATGWLYDVWGDGWVLGSEAAGCVALGDGDRVRWRLGAH